MKQIIQAPEDARQMLLSFLLFDKAAGLPSMTRQIDFSGVTRRQVIACTSGRLPTKPRNAVDTAPFNPAAAFTRALSAPEFQTRIREIVLGAFPEKRRLIFIHIAKCAGTDLEAALRRRHPFLHHIMSIPEATPQPELFDSLRLVAIGMQFSDHLALSGHVPLGWYLKQSMVRIQDDVFSAVRHPRERIYSQISYMLTMMVKFRGTLRFDTAGWLSAIGLTDIGADPSPDDLLDIGRRLLRVRHVVGPDGICNALGDGTKNSAVEKMVLADIEITDTDRYSAWRTAKFGFSPPGRINISQPLFTEAHTNAADRRVLDDLIGEDMLLYETIQKRLKASDGLSIRGRSFG